MMCWWRQKALTLKYLRASEILAGTQAIQPAALTGDEGGTPPEDPVVIPDHTLFGNYPPKIAEAEVKPETKAVRSY